jgi:predicted Fe-S protein YdhL (DUF1289 family)
VETGTDDPHVICVGCGRVAAIAYGWTTQHDSRGRTWLCAACTRRDLDRIEAMLDHDLYPVSRPAG